MIPTSSQENLLPIPESIGDLSTTFFECHHFLYDRVGWTSHWKERLRFLGKEHVKRCIDVLEHNMIEKIRAWEFRGYQFEPPDEESWKRFCDRVQGRYDVEL